jgi:stage V sporulation protein S
VADTGLDLVCVPSFSEVEIEGEKRTALRLMVDDRIGQKSRQQVPQ